MSNIFKKHKKTIVIGAVILIALVIISVLFALNNPNSQAAMQGRSMIILLGLAVVLFYSFFNLRKKGAKTRRHKGAKVRRR